MVSLSPLAMLWAGVFLAITIVLDTRTRRFPAWWFLSSFAIVVCWYPKLSIFGGFVALLLVLVADFPGGDIRCSIILGLIVGPQLVSVLLAAAFLLTLIAWKRGLTEVPWTVYIGIVYLAYVVIYSAFIPRG